MCIIYVHLFEISQLSMMSQKSTVNCIFPICYTYIIHVPVICSRYVPSIFPISYTYIIHILLLYVHPISTISPLYLSYVPPMPPLYPLRSPYISPMFPPISIYIPLEMWDSTIIFHNLFINYK